MYTSISNIYLYYIGIVNKYIIIYNLMFENLRTRCIQHIIHDTIYYSTMEL